jgi:hypothetical protein
MFTRSDSSPSKLLARNVAAVRRGQTAADQTRLMAGNPVSTRLEAGVGNCFPGLECDLRNIERRFFPYLEVNIADQRVSVVDVQMSEARFDSSLSAEQLAVYEAIATSLEVKPDGESNWTITSISGDFGPLGQLDELSIASLSPPSTGPNRKPTDGWMAIRLLKEGSRITLALSGPSDARQLEGIRSRYLGDDGALAAMFLPGEMTQSLCSPWTHDFRDCACFYWASNHPDIVQPARPVGATDPNWNDRVDWERSERSQACPPPAETPDGPAQPKMAHYDINARWEKLHFVVRGREQIEAIQKETPAGSPIETDLELVASLRLAAGVELAVMQEYLCAAFSLMNDDGSDSSLNLAVRATRSEIMRIAIGEMRHLRVVNEVLSLLPSSSARATPALQVSTRVPTLVSGKPSFRSKQWRPLTAQVLDDFVEIESAAHAIDQLYSNIMATFHLRGYHQLESVIASIIADGEDHLETFQFMREWLTPFSEVEIVRPDLSVPEVDEPVHQTFQEAYRTILADLYVGYATGLPGGATEVNEARQKMVEFRGLAGLASQIANAGFLVTFDDLTDPRFQPLPG